MEVSNWLVVFYRSTQMNEWVWFECMFGGWGRVCFSQESDVVVNGEGVFVEHRFGLRLNRVLD